MEMSIDQVEDFRGMKGFRKRANRAEFLCLITNLRRAVRCDQKDVYLRLQIKQIGDDLEPGAVCQKQIDDTKTEAPFARLVKTITTVSDKHHFVALRLKHQPERVAY